MKKEDGIQQLFLGSLFNYYGWIILIVAAIGLFFSGPGQTYSISVFIDYYIHKHNWSRSLISSLYSMATLTAGLILPIIGRKIDSIGHRKMMTIIPILLGLTCFWMGFVQNTIMIFIGFLFLRLFGQGSMTLMPSTIVPKWFIKKRGLALSLMSLGGAIGSASIPVLNNLLINKLGLSYTWGILGTLLIIFMAPMAWIFIRNEPEDIGLIPYGGKDIGQIDNSQTHDEQSWSLKQAMKIRTFWLILFCMLIPSMINTGLTFHMVSIMKSKGYSSGFAALILSIIATTQLPCTFLAGYIVDKFKVHYVMGVNFLIMLLSMVALFYGKSSIWIILYGVLNGIFMAFNSVSTNVIWPNYFGRKHLATIRGVAMTAVVIGSSLGPLPFGFSYDIFKGYSEILVIMTVFPVMGSIFSFISPPPKYKNS